jgi:hypothetical protein
VERIVVRRNHGSVASEDSTMMRQTWAIVSKPKRAAVSPRYALTMMPPVRVDL